MCYNACVKGDEFLNFMKTITDKETAKALINNIAKLRKKVGPNNLGIVQNKSGEVFYLVNGLEREGVLSVLKADNLEEAGKLVFDIKEKGNMKFADLIRIKINSKFTQNGLATQVLKYFEHNMKEEGVKQISLDANTNTYLGDWYKKLGYNQITNYIRLKNIMIKTHLKKYKRARSLSEVIDDKTQYSILKPRFKFAGQKKKLSMLKELNLQCC